MHGPKKIKPAKLADYLETMSKAVFQTGISWRVVETKWPGTMDAFKGFEPAVVARFNAGDVDNLVADSRIIRNRRKIEGIIENAQRMLELEREYGSFKKYLRSFRSYNDLEKDLKRQFRFVGETGIYYFLWVVGEKVPPWEEWNKTRVVAAQRVAASGARHSFHIK
jgi:DNA-3-methyladenine glycosylase I